MQGSHLFEYAVIRVVPRPEREEFLNVGVIVFCAGLSFLQMKFLIDDERMRVFCNGLDVPDLKSHLEAFQRICLGEEKNSPISRLDAASRFRWLTATRSTVVQTSKVHPGFTADPAATLNHLYEQLVG